MLKIWLAWLQPSLGVMGLVLFLTSPLFTLAAQKPTTVSRASKAIQSKSVVTGATKASTDAEPTGIAATPDVSVRQIAVDALDPNNSTASAAAASRQQSNRDALDSFLTPSTPKVAALKATKLKSVKSPVNKALARTAPAKQTVPVTGIFIGNSEVRGISKYAPDTSRSAQPIASAEIGAPTSLSAMMGASKPVSPYPVVSPEMMQKLEKNPAVAKTPAPQPLNPIATLPSGAKQILPAVKSVATVPANVKTAQSLKPTMNKLDRVVPQSLDPIAKIPAAFRQEVPTSLDPIASIPAGLQRLLGNKLNDRPTAAPVRVAKAIAPKASPVLAINNLISPTSLAVAPSGSSLQLATAQAYAVTVPKFDIPGERLAVVAPAEPATANVSFNSLQKATLVTKVQSKDDYLSLTARQFETNSNQPWILIGQSNNLGGLILGSQPQTILSDKTSLSTNSDLTTAGSQGLSAIGRREIN